MGALPRPDLPPGHQRELVAALHALHHRAGWPSLRVIAARVGCSHTTVSAVFSAPRLPSWGILELVVEALGGDAAELRALWLAASVPDDTPAPLAVVAGRDQELGAVDRHLGEGTGLLLVTGEAGIGKTRLVTSAAPRSGRTLVARGSCLPLSTDVPLLPVVDALRWMLESDGRWFAEALRGCAPFVTDSLRRLLPELDDEAAAPLGPADEWSRLRLFSAIATALSALATRRPVALVLEDLHWADSATLDLLEHLQVRPCRLPTVGTFRTDDPSTPRATADWCARMQRLPTVRTLALGPLSLEDTAVQIEQLLAAPPGPAMVREVHRRTEGQPLFTEQLVAQLGNAEPLPRLLGELLDRRTEGLTPGARAVSRALAVAGRPLTPELLARATGLGAAELVRALHELDDRRLLRPGAGNAVELRHPLLGEAVHRHLFATEAAEEHGRMAAALAATEDVPAAEVAEHWQRAGDRVLELDWRIRAAREAGRRFAVAQEAAQWRRVLDLWPDGVDTAGRPATGRGEAYLAAMDALEFIDVGAAWSVAEEAIGWLPDPDGAQAAEVYRRAADHSGNLGDWHTALRLAESAVRIHESLPPSLGYVNALSTCATQLGAVGRGHEEAAMAARAAEVCAGLGEPTTYRTRLSVQALTAATTGDLELALSLIDRAEDVETTAPDPMGVIYQAINHGIVLMLAGRGPDEVLAAARPGLEEGAGWGLDTWPLSVLRGNVAMAMRRAGQVQRAAVLIDPVTEEAPTHLRAGEHQERAALDVLRGRLDSATERFEALASIPASGLHNTIEATEEHVAADLWAGRPDAAFQRLMAVLREAVDTDAPADLSTMLVLAVRAAADVAAWHASPSIQRRASLTVLQHLRDRFPVDPFAPLPAFALRPATRASWAAESARLLGEPGVGRWAAAAREWDRIGRPHDAAYCRWRAAQAALASGEGTTAHGLLRRARLGAAEHVPLLAAIEDAMAHPRLGALSGPAPRRGG